jgi:DNA-binding protein H-NS
VRQEYVDNLTIYRLTPYFRNSDKSAVLRPPTDKRFLEGRMALKSLSVDKLLKLKSDVEAALASKVREQRRELELKLSKLDRFQEGRSRGGLRGARGAVAPNYRNPENPTETWAGRGLQPRWLAAAIKSGNKLEDFAIAPTAGAGPGKTIKKTSRRSSTKKMGKKTKR